MEAFAKGGPCYSRILLAAFGVVVSAVAQDPQFEVATVRPSGPQSTGPAGARQWKSGGAGSKDPERLTYTLMPLRVLLMDAYGVQPDQIAGPAGIDAGPAWIDKRYDVAAKVPAGATREEQYLMLRSLLIERFHMSVRLEPRELPGYVLTIAKGGSKLKESAAGLKESVADPDVTRSPGLAACRPPLDKDGVPQLPAAAPCGPIGAHPRDSGKTYIVARQIPMARFVVALRPSLPVGTQRIADKTGLTGNYDFHLGFSGTGFSANASPGQDPSGLPDIFAALEEQLGLKLEKAKLSINMVIVDHADKVPAEN